MRQMIDPSTIKVDTSNLAKLNKANYFKINNTASNQIRLDINSLAETEVVVISEDNNRASRYGAYYPRIGVTNTSYKDSLYMNPREGKTAFARQFAGYFNLYTLPFTNTDNTTHNLLSDKTLKTLFGQKIYSKDGTGNIDLYKHNIKGVSGDNQVYISIPSSKNTPINSITDLNTYLSNDNYYPATGVYKDGTTFYPIVFMTKSNNVWSVTYNKGTELGTALISTVAETITDTVTTV